MARFCSQSSEKLDTLQCGPKVLTLLRKAKARNLSSVNLYQLKSYKSVYISSSSYEVLALYIIIFVFLQVNEKALN